jgi:hypothetical protein
MSKEFSARALRELVALRARGCCEYCRCPENHATSPYSVEHVYPASRGGPTRPDNLAFSCQGCNNQKYNKIASVDPQTGETVPLFNPRTQRWREHFAWSEDFTRVIGLTPTGRATVEELGLNRCGAVNLRAVLLLARLHPPPDGPEPEPPPSENENA